ncbi:unnamed protein product [Peronospora destructor]|uniref:Uncharacterized protein n=1 Tax=Peronospora destructor TaxID=86335 RepID=A0AAV0TLY0_9STRA|nr:unnamed protein product [Peronospora destructor]
MVFPSSLKASVSTRQLRQCTCTTETESDSDNDSDTGHSVVNEVATENEVLIRSSSPTSSKWSNSLSLLQQSTTTHDPLKASQALHNAEALRQASALNNVFCRCYDVDTVLSTVQRRERGHFSPVQKLLLKPESIQQVFLYATSVTEMDSSFRENGQHNKNDPNVQNPEKYRQAFVATEMILRFYLKVMKWYGDPKQDEMEDSGNMTDKEIETVTEQETIRRQPNGQLTGQTVSSTRSNTNTLMDFWSNASARKTARVQRLRASMRFESSGSSVSDFNGSGDEDIELLENPSSRGYLLRLEDLTAKEWKRIFGGLFRFLWPQSKSDGAEKAEDSDDEVEVDNVLVANMCKITKNFVIFPGVLRLICDENEADEKECLLSRLAAHVYNPEIASMLHGLIHLSNRRGFEYFRIIRCLVQLMVEQLPTRLVRSLSSVSSTSTVSSTSSFSPRSSVGGALTIPSSSFFSSKTALLSPLLFTSNTASIVHSRINGCAELLSKNPERRPFPNTASVITLQTKLQRSVI